MFSKAGILELHGTTHERLDLLLRHVATVPEELLRKPISGFGHPSIWKQLIHILTCEEGWVHDLQNQPFPGWSEEDCPTMDAVEAAKRRIREATRTYVGRLTEEQLNTTLAQRAVDWGGELRSLRSSCCTPYPTHFTTKARLSRCSGFSDIQHRTQICSRYSPRAKFILAASE